MADHSDAFVATERESGVVVLEHDDAACRSLTGEEVMGLSLDGGRLRGCRTPQQAQDAGGGVIDQVFVEPARMHGSDDVVV